MDNQKQCLDAWFRSKCIHVPGRRAAERRRKHYTFVQALLDKILTEPDGSVTSIEWQQAMVFAKALEQQAEATKLVARLLAEWGGVAGGAGVAPARGEGWPEAG